MTSTPVVLAVMLVGGIAAGWIAASRGQTGGALAGYAALGFFFPIIGIIIAALIRPPEDEQEPGAPRRPR
jgi:hypothetical protein